MQVKHISTFGIKPLPPSNNVEHGTHCKNRVTDLYYNKALTFFPPPIHPWKVWIVTLWPKLFVLLF